MTKLPKDYADWLSPWMWDESYADHRARREEKEDAEHLQQILSQSTAADTAELRLALARILVDSRHTKSYGGGCVCGGKGCWGHVPEDVKIARAALGLPELPDRERVSKPPETPRKRKDPAKKKRVE